MSQLTTVLSTATDLGAAGIDDVYGVGLLDLAEASRPQGSLAVAGTDGRIEGVSPQTTSIVPSAVFGQAFAHRQPTLGLIDSFGRAFEFQPRLGTAQQYEVTPDELMALLSDEGDRQDQPLISAGYLSLAVSGGQLDDDLSVSLYNQQMRLDTGRTKRIFFGAITALYTRGCPPRYIFSGNKLGLCPDCIRQNSLQLYAVTYLS